MPTALEALNWSKEETAEYCEGQRQINLLNLFSEGIPEGIAKPIPMDEWKDITIDANGFPKCELVNPFVAPPMPEVPKLSDEHRFQLEMSRADEAAGRKDIFEWLFESVGLLNP